ncbi:hypothetical protein ACMFMG_010714 [Clarireedia jacksonii]
MAHSTSTALTFLALTYFIYLITAHFLQTRRLRLKAQQLKCSPAPHLLNRLPLGIDHVHRAVHGIRTNRFHLALEYKHRVTNALTYHSQILGRDTIGTADETNIQAVLATQFHDFDASRDRLPNIEPFFGVGIFGHDGREWEHDRALLRPQFARANLTDLDVEEKHVGLLFEALMQAGEGGEGGWGKEVDLMPLLYRLALDASTEFLLGESVMNQRAAMERARRGAVAGKGEEELMSDVEAFGKEFDNATRVIAVRSRFAPYYWLYSPRSFSKSIKVCHRLVDGIIEKHLKSLGAAEKVDMTNGLDEKTNEKERYVFLHQLSASTRDPVELRGHVMNMLIAGRDTTSSLLSFVFAALARDPARYAKLRGIILETFGSYDDASSARDNITFASIKSCKYLQYVLNETMRVWPLVPVNARIANRDTTLPRGGGADGRERVFVPKGTLVEYSVWVMHRREDLWGEDAEVWRPERWEGKRVGWGFLPFNGGPRICLGQQYALTEASYVIIRFLQKFDRMEAVGKDELDLKFATTLSPANGVKVRLHEAGGVGGGDGRKERAED